VVPPTPATGVETKRMMEQIVVDVKTLTGKTLKIATCTADTVAELREGICRSEGPR